MRTNEQTYLSKLGFLDSDRNSELHDKICMRLCVDKNADKLVSMIMEEFGIFPGRVDLENVKHLKYYKEDRGYDPTLPYGMEENYINGVRTITYHPHVIGIVDKKVSYFLGYRPVYFDVLFKLSVTSKISQSVEYEEDIILMEQDKESWSKYVEKGKTKKIVSEDRECIQSQYLIIEVKNKRQNIVSCIQQLNTYREFCSEKRYKDRDWGYVNISGFYDDLKPIFVLATMYPLDELEQMVLRQNKIVWVNLLDLKKTQDS